MSNCNVLDAFETSSVFVAYTNICLSFSTISFLLMHTLISMILLQFFFHRFADFYVISHLVSISLCLGKRLLYDFQIKPCDRSLIQRDLARSFFFPYQSLLGIAPFYAANHKMDDPKTPEQRAANSRIISWHSWNSMASESNDNVHTTQTHTQTTSTRTTTTM